MSNQCKKKNSLNSNVNSINDRNVALTNTNVNNSYESFIVGRWEGRMWTNGTEDIIVKYLTFRPDGKMIEVDNTPNHPFSDKERIFDYEVLNDGVIKSDRFPNNLKIHKLSTDEIRFEKVIGNDMEESVDIVYACRFYRVTNNK